MRRREISGIWSDRINRNIYNLNSFCLNWLEFTGRYDMPVIKPCHAVPEKLFPFDERNKYQSGDGAIHFYCHDAEFEQVWLRANRHPHVPPVVQKAGMALTPDFSLFTDYPIASQIWNVYRSRLLGALWQHQGIQVIPSVVWGDRASFDFCFDGLPVGGTLAVAVTYVKTPDEQLGFTRGFREMCDRCKPDTVLVYGRSLRGFLEYLHPNVRRYDSRLTQIYYARKEQREKTKAAKLEIEQRRIV